jgi:uncharacterized protein
MRSLGPGARLFSAGLMMLTAMNAPAVSQDRRCLSIVDLNERIDCLEGRTQAAGPNPTNTPRDLRQQLRTRVAPSFDCHVATSSIERAICSDDELAEWDSRMGQIFQQLMRLRKDNQAALEGQRRWIVQRNAVCGRTSEIPFSCLLEMTKQRVSALSEEVAAAATVVPQSQSQETPQPPPASPSPPVALQSTPLPIVPSTNPTQPEINPSNQNNAALPTTRPQTTSMPTNVQDQGYNPLFIVIALGMALWLGLKVLSDIQRRQALVRRRQDLVARFGEHDAERILAGEVWQGMTDEQLIESWGSPVDKDSEIKRTKTKETWKYGQTGRNRFNNRVFLENGIVIGWKR